jgi:hypothetical protein
MQPIIKYAIQQTMNYRKCTEEEAMEHLLLIGISHDKELGEYVKNETIRIAQLTKEMNEYVGKP